MSILGFLFKSKKEMARENTKQVKVGKYTLTSHIQNRIADKTRKTSKVDVIDNLFTRPNAKTNVRIDEFGRPSYNRVGKRITTSVNPENHNVVSCRPISKQEIKKFDLQNVGKRGRTKYVKRNSKKQIHTKSKTRSKKNS